MNGAMSLNETEVIGQRRFIEKYVEDSRKYGLSLANGSPTRLL